MSCWLLILFALPIVASANDKNATVIDNVAYTKPQRLVTVEPDRKLNIYCTGTGSPTVIFESGLGDGTRVWGLIQPDISQHTRTCSYDRAGLGFSDSPTRPSTSANVVDDLHRLLRAAHVKPPYILVGHSSGGMHIKLYAETHLSDVAGLVFVDASHEDMGKAIWAIDPDSRHTFAPYIAILHKCLGSSPDRFVPGSQLVKYCGPFSDARYSTAINAIELKLGKQHGRIQARVSEQENIWFTSADEVRAAYRPLGDIPIIVLTHEASARSSSETQEQRDAKNKLWLDLHSQIAAMSTRGKRMTVENAGHYIQWDQPQVVIDSILEVLHTARDR